MAEKKLTIRVDANTAGLSRGMKAASAQVNTFGSSIQKGITRHAAGIRKTGMALAGLGAAMTGMAVVSIKAAADFEKELAIVSTMLDKSAMHLMPEYELGLRNMAKEFGESTKTLSKGLYDILSASIPPAKALDVLGVSAKAAVAGITDTGVAADAITTIINAYGLAAEDAGDVSDWLFAIVKKGKTTFNELAPAIGKVATVAKMAGVSMDELGAMVATLTRSGIKTDQAMTAVIGVLRTFLKASDQGAKTAEVFGVTLDTNTLKTEGLVGVMKKLVAAESEQLAQIFPNIRGLIGFSAALSNAEGFAEDLAFMQDRLGLSQEALEKQTNTLSFVWGQIKEEFHDVLVVLGKELIPIIKTEFVPLMREVIEHMKVWIERFKGLSPSVKKLLLLLGPLLIALGGFMMILPGLATAIGLLMGPIGWIALAIAGLTAVFVYFYTTNEKFRNVIKGIGKEIKGAFQDWYTLGVNIKNWIVWFAKNFVKYWVAVWTGSVVAIKNGVENVKILFDWLSEFIKGWGIWFGTNFLNVWKNLFSAVQTGFANFGKNIAAQVGWLWEKIKKPFSKVPRPDWTPLFEDFKAEWAELPKFTELKMKQMAQGIKVEWEPMPGWVTPTFDAIKKGSKEGADGIGKLNDKLKDTKKETKEMSKSLKEANKWLLAVGLSGKKIPLTTISDWADKYQKKVNAELEKTNRWLVAIKSSAKPLPGTGITDWYSKYQKFLNDELEKTNKWLVFIKSSAKKLPGTGITDWYKKYQEYLNDELEKTNHWLVSIESQAKRLPGTGITDWYNKYQKFLNDELEKTNHWLIAVESQAKKLPGTSITDWCDKYQKFLNDALEKTNHWLVAIESQAKKLPGTSITDWYEKYQTLLNDELEQTNLWLVAIESQAKKLPGTTITDWADKYQKFLNDELEKTNHWLTAIESQAKKLPGTSITDWYKKYQKLLNDELEKTDHWLVVIESQAKKLPGTSITDWAEKDQKAINDELEKTQKLLDAVGRSTVKLPGTTLTDWAQKYQAQLNHELRMSQKYLEGIGLAAGRLPVKTISDWAKYQALANAELSKTQEILIALGLATRDFSKEQLVLTNFFNWLAGKLKEEKEKWAKSWLEYFEEVHDMHFRSAEDFEKWWNERDSSEKTHLQDSKANWEGHVADLDRIWDGFTTSVKSSMSDMFYDLMSGTSNFKDAWQSFCDSIKQSFIRSLADMIVEKLGMDQLFSGNILEWGNLFSGLGSLITNVFKGVGSAVWGVMTNIGSAVWGVVKGVGSAIGGMVSGAIGAVGKIAAALGPVGIVVAALGVAIVALGVRIRGTTTHFESAWGTMGRSFWFTNIELGELAKHLEETGQLMYPLVGTTVEMGDAAAYVERQFKEVGLTISQTVGEAQSKLEELRKVQSEGSEEDQAMTKRKIALTEIEIKLLEIKKEREANRHSARAKQLEDELALMLEAYHAGSEDYEAAEQKKQEATKQTTDAVISGNEQIKQSSASTSQQISSDMGLMASNVIQSISKIPKDMLIDIRAELSGMGRVQGSLAAIPRDITTYVRAVYEGGGGGASFQHGGTLEEGELVLSRPITNWIKSALSKSGPMGSTPSTRNPASNPAGSVTVNVPRGAVVVYGDIRTKMDEEEFQEKVNRELAEDVARRLIEP